MNPVLLKPQSEVGAQIVVQGRVYGTAKAADYQKIKPELMRFVLESYCSAQAGSRPGAGRGRGQRLGSEFASP